MWRIIELRFYVLIAYLDKLLSESSIVSFRKTFAIAILWLDATMTGFLTLAKIHNTRYLAALFAKELSFPAFPILGNVFVTLHFGLD